jgi:branched-chain amino acid transport system permease protein
VVAAVGFISEKLLFHPIRHEETRTMIVALGLSIIAQNLAVIFFGTENLSFNSPVQGVLQFGQISISQDSLVTVGVTIMVLIVFYYFLRYTKLGLALQALAQDEEVAKVQGINTKQIYALAFAIGAALAAVAGGLMGSNYSVSPFMGSLPIMKAFVVVILGGLGSIPGAVLGGLVLAMAESFVSTYLGSSTSDMIGFLLVIVILLIKPSGLLGLKEG